MYGTWTDFCFHYQKSSGSPFFNHWLRFVATKMGNPFTWAGHRSTPFSVRHKPTYPGQYHLRGGFSSKEKVSYIISRFLFNRGFRLLDRKPDYTFLNSRLHWGVLRIKWLLNLATSARIPLLLIVANLMHQSGLFYWHTVSVERRWILISLLDHPATSQKTDFL